MEQRTLGISVGYFRVRGFVNQVVLSSLLWNLLVDNLVRALNTFGFYTIAYADDIIGLVVGRYGRFKRSSKIDTKLTNVDFINKRRVQQLHPRQRSIVEGTKPHLAAHRSFSNQIITLIYL